MNKLPYKIITTSWDDGHRADLKLAKILTDHQLPATFYMSPQNRELTPADRLTSEQIQQIATQHEIGAHTLTHPVLNKIPLDEAKAEIEGSRMYLKQLTGQSIDMFCYPRGAYNRPVRDIVEAAGYIGARTIQPFQTRPPQDYYQLGTTKHAYPVHVNYALRLALLHNPRFFMNVTSRNWLTVAAKTFDYVNDHGGIWHLWGHSWELEDQNLWSDFELLCRQVANRPGFTYLTNSQLVAFLRQQQGRA